MFGFEDNLLHRLASITNLFTANHMQERFWPVHVSHDTKTNWEFHTNKGLGPRRWRCS